MFLDHVGEWKNGKSNGQGTWYSPDGIVMYFGGYKEGMFHGIGTQFLPGIFKYEGEYKYGKRHGQGIMTYFNGGTYVGEFKDGERNGQGTITYPNGRKYVGEWKDGGFWNGTIYDKNRNITGKWVNGKRIKQ